MKKGVIGILFIVSLVLVVSTISVSALQCSIVLKTASACGPNERVMGVSDLTNAHGEKNISGVYQYVLCCDQSSSNECTGNNKVIGLSSDTNAHAEIPSLNNYPIDVCFADLECINSTDTSPPAEYPIPVLSLSSQTNAHIGNIGDYSYNIYCKSRTTPIAFWAYVGGVEITDPIDVSPGNTIVKVVLENPPPVGSNVRFEIYELDGGRDFGSGNDDLIKNETVNVTDSRVVSYGWTISQSDLDTGNDHILESCDTGIGNCNLKFYFVVYEVSTGDQIRESGTDLTINELLSPDWCIDNNVFSCSNYDESQCVPNDVCGVADENPGIDCSDPNVDCLCRWDGSNCNDVYTVFTTGSYCGDSSIDSYDTYNEVCDPNDATPVFPSGISSCSNINTDLSGNLGCSDACLYTGCSPTGNEICGDGIVNSLDEECDGNNNLNGWSCSALGYGGGSLSCDSSCKLVKSDCTSITGSSYCGDGTVNSPNSAGLFEQCDGTGSVSCTAASGGFYNDGDITCTNYCGYDFSSCGDHNPSCGNNIVDGPTEECDDPNQDGTGDFGTHSCTQLGFESGTLRCNSDCTTDTTSCLAPEATTVLGSCTITSGSDDEDDCDDGFITYNWTATWSEGPNDPNKPDTCVDGQQTLQCPAQIQLPFFGFYNFILTALTIALIYGILNLRNRRKY